MKRNRTALLLLALAGMVALPLTAMAADDWQARNDMENRERAQAEALRGQEEAIRRMEATQARIQEAQVRRDMEDQERVRAQAMRDQDESIRRIEATQARMQASSQQLARQSEEQARSYSYPVYPLSIPSTPRIQSSPVAPAVSLSPDRARQNDLVSRINFAPLSERLKSYFGTQSGVLVVSTGGDAPFGLQDGDVLIAIDGRVPVDGPHAAGILRSYQPGEGVKLRVQRDRRVIDLSVTIPMRAN